MFTIFANILSRDGPSCLLIKQSPPNLTVEVTAYDTQSIAAYEVAFVFVAKATEDFISDFFIS